MANHHLRPQAHATGVGNTGSWSTMRIATCALFVAVSLVASFIELPIFPAAPWLKYDPSGIVCLIAGLAFGAGTGALVAVLSWLPHLFMDPFGGLVAILCAVALTVPAALVYHRWQSRPGAIVGMVVASCLTLGVAIGTNLVITPLYAGISMQAVLAMIVPILLPFNALKVLITCAATLALYKPVSKLVGA